MKILMGIIAILLLFSAPLSSFAVSYPVQLYPEEERHDKFVKGDTVYLFHSGGTDVLKNVHVHDTLTVYRITASCEEIPIGIIKVVSFVGDIYVKGEVFAGEIKPDDVAKKGNISFLVVSAAKCDNKR